MRIEPKLSNSQRRDGRGTHGFGVHVKVGLVVFHRPESGRAFWDVRLVGEVSFLCACLVSCAAAYENHTPRSAFPTPGLFAWLEAPMAPPSAPRKATVKQGMSTPARLNEWAPAYI